jgi:hypothetical protein
MNKRGVALILSYMVIVILTVFGAIFGYRSVSESSIAKRYTESSRAFWIAETGLTNAYYSLINNQEVSSSPISLAGGTYQIQQSQTSYGREVKSIGTYGSSQRITKGYLYLIPLPFKNTISVGKNLYVSGNGIEVNTWGRTRVSGSYVRTSPGSTLWFQNFEQGSSSDDTTMKIPDKDGNGVTDQYNDFVYWGKEMVLSYPSVYVKLTEPDAKVTIFPNSEQLSGVNVIFVEGPYEGTGNVDIFLNGTTDDSQQLTIVSTGTITYFDPYQWGTNATMNTASWLDYNEASTLSQSTRNGTIFAHRNVNFDDIMGKGYTTSNIIANGNLYINEIVTKQRFDFSDRGLNGGLAPGFEYLEGCQRGMLSTQLINWQEQALSDTQEEEKVVEENPAAGVAESRL